MYDIAIIMSCVKQARQIESPTLVDSFIDDVNYTAIAGQFAAAKFETIEDDIAAMARRFAPKRENLNAENNSDNNSGDPNSNRVDPPAGG
jgi:hypothetical protein